MQKYLVRAAKELDLRIVAPTEIQLDNNRKFFAEALFLDLGYPNGILVSQSYEDFLSKIEELKKLGYGLSVFNEPLPNEEFDLESYKEMFVDWGWAGDISKKPIWM